MTPTGGHPREGSQSSLRLANRRRLIELLRNTGSMTQAQMARASGLSPATVSNIVAELRDAERVDVEHIISGGRRAQQVSLARHSGVSIGLAFGHGQIQAVVVDQTLKLLASHSHPIDTTKPIDEALRRGADLVLRTLAASGIALNGVSAFGVALPAPIDRRSGRVGVTSVVRQWIGVDPRPILKAAVGIEPTIDNDANLGALAEASWSGQADRSNLVYVTVGNGVGAGLILNRMLFRGTSGLAGELGHFCVDLAGDLCLCGNRGCLETTVSDSLVVELLGRDRPIRSVRQALELAQSGDPRCRRVITSMGRDLGVALAGMSNVIDPGLILISGSLTDIGDLFMSSIREAFKKHALRSIAHSTPIVISPLGSTAPALGAAVLGFHQLDSADSPDVLVAN